MTAPPPSLIVLFDDEEHLAREYAARLARGVVFTGGGVGVRPGNICEVVLLHPTTGDSFSLPARVVSVGSEGFVVCRIEGFGPDVDARLKAFAGVPAPDEAPIEEPATFEDDGVPFEEDVETTPAGLGRPDTAEDEAASDDLGEGFTDEIASDDLDDGSTDELIDALDADTVDDPDLALDSEDVLEVDDEVDAVDADTAETDAELVRTKIPAHVQERLRHLKLHEVYRVARTGNLAERIALERIFGKTVWEPLLQNQNLTPPEVARIARMGTLPRPLLDMIASHQGWLSKSLVQRALLSNPRLGGRALTKVLHSLPKTELALVPQQAAYPWRTREAAKRLLGK
jgi:hypothetical protein